MGRVGVVFGVGLVWLFVLRCLFSFVGFVLFSFAGVCLLGMLLGYALLWYIRGMFDFD